MDYTRDESAIFTESKGQRQVKTDVISYNNKLVQAAVLLGLINA